MTLIHEKVAKMIADECRSYQVPADATHESCLDAAKEIVAACLKDFIYRIEQAYEEV